MKDLSFRLISKVPEDVNSYATKFNLDRCKLEVLNSSVIVKADVLNMVAFESSSESQGVAKWVGLLIGVEPGEDLTQYEYNGQALTADDITEAASVGGNPWEFVLWIGVEVVAADPKVITISKGDESITKVIKVDDISIDFKR